MDGGYREDNILVCHSLMTSSMIHWGMIDALGKVNLSYTPIPSQPRGMINTGNTCYMNSVGIFVGLHCLNMMHHEGGGGEELRIH